MTCKAEVIESKQVNNEMVSYRIVCCGEKCSEKCKPSAHQCEDSWHTLSVTIEDHASRLELRKAEVEARHTKMKSWRAKQALDTIQTVIP